MADIDALGADWDDWMRRSAPRVKEIFELRMILETQVASLAAQRATPDDIRAIEATLEEAGPTEESLIRRHTAFDDALGAATHNERLQRAVRDLPAGSPGPRRATPSRDQGAPPRDPGRRSRP